MGRKETEEAIEEARRGGLKRFDSVGALFADLNADDTPEIHEGVHNQHAHTYRLLYEQGPVELTVWPSNSCL